MAPDGDADLTQAQIDGFQIAHCARCDGLLKPDVVFFGENVPPERVEETWQRFAEAEVLLVVGSSLAVRSGYRYVEAAVRQAKPVAIVNDGPTRADGEATLKVEGRLGQVLPALVARLS
jgi:NAD-dependent SIR2 family protein deacetylase